MKVSIIIPVYNEAQTIAHVINEVTKASLGPELEREIVVVDDGSKDETAKILAAMNGIRIVRHQKNVGKGGALKTGFMHITGDVVIIQDADLEYDPADYEKLLEPILAGRADVVFGNRFLGEHHNVIYFRNYIGNKFLTFLSNVFTGFRIGDMEVGYKVMRKEVVHSFRDKLVSKHFGIEPELVSRIAHSGRWRVAEVPVSYDARTYAEGKKIRAWDGLKAIFAIVYFNLFD